MGEENSVVVLEDILITPLAECVRMNPSGRTAPRACARREWSCVCRAEPPRVKKNRALIAETIVLLGALPVYTPLVSFVVTITRAADLEVVVNSTQVWRIRGRATQVVFPAKQPMLPLTRGGAGKLMALERQRVGDQFVATAKWYAHNVFAALKEGKRPKLIAASVDVVKYISYEDEGLIKQLVHMVEDAVLPHELLDFARFLAVPVSSPLGIVCAPLTPPWRKIAESARKEPLRWMLPFCPPARPDVPPAFACAEDALAYAKKEEIDIMESVVRHRKAREGWDMLVRSRNLGNTCVAFDPAVAALAKGLLHDAMDPPAIVPVPNSNRLWMTTFDSALQSIALTRGSASSQMLDGHTSAENVRAFVETCVGACAVRTLGPVVGVEYLPDLDANTVILAPTWDYAVAVRGRVWASDQPALGGESLFYTTDAEDDAITAAVRTAHRIYVVGAHEYGLEAFAFLLMRLRRLRKCSDDSNVVFVGDTELEPAHLYAGAGTPFASLCASGRIPVFELTPFEVRVDAIAKGDEELAEFAERVQNMRDGTINFASSGPISVVSQEEFLANVYPALLAQDVKMCNSGKELTSMIVAEGRAAAGYGARMLRKLSTARRVLIGTGELLDKETYSGAETLWPRGGSGKRMRFLAPVGHVACITHDYLDGKKTFYPIAPSARERWKYSYILHDDPRKTLRSHSTQPVVDATVVASGYFVHPALDLLTLFVPDTGAKLTRNTLYRALTSCARLQLVFEGEISRASVRLARAMANVRMRTCAMRYEP